MNCSLEWTQHYYLLLFLSGHGGMDRQSNYYFFAYDHDPKDDLEVSNIKWNTILDRLTATPGKAILMVDTCRAGAIASGGERERTVKLHQIIEEIQNDNTRLRTLAAPHRRASLVGK